MMRRERWCRRTAALLLLLVAPLGASAQLQTPRTPYLEAAEGIGRWLLEASEHGARWPVHASLGDVVQVGFGLGLESGAAGLGLFFLQLHRHSGDPAQLALAIRAAEYERSRHLAGTYGGPDYLGGAAGSGLFLLALHARTGDPRYVEWAEGIADWHHRTSVLPAVGERFWEHSPNFPRHYTGIPHGAAGVAIFHLGLHHRTGRNPLYLQMAEEAYRWLRNHALALDAQGAIGFKRLVDDSDVYNWWSGGSAGILLLQAMLYGSTGNPAYLDDLRRTADGLVALAEPAAPAGVNWTTGRPPNTFRPIVYSHGNASVAPALLIAHEHLGDPRYLATAEASVDWLQGIARGGSDYGAPGLYWLHNTNADAMPVNGALVGTASVGWMLARIHSLSGQPRLRALALDSADYMLAIGETRGSDQRRWRTYMGPENTHWGPLLFRTGWYDGNAGIGLFLLAAHELATGQRPGLEVHAP